MYIFPASTHPSVGAFAACFVHTLYPLYLLGHLFHAQISGDPICKFSHLQVGTGYWSTECRNSQQFSKNFKNNRTPRAEFNMTQAELHQIRAAPPGSIDEMVEVAQLIGLRIWCGTNLREILMFLDDFWDESYRALHPNGLWVCACPWRCLILKALAHFSWPYPASRKNTAS